MNNTARKVGAFFYMPLFFLIIGYLTFYIVGRPLINFTASTVELFLLNKAPSFETKYEDIFTPKKTEENAEQDTGNTQETQPETLKLSETQLPEFGNRYGEILIDNLQIEEPLYYGDSDDILRLGAGQFAGSVVPGLSGTTLIGGHNTSSFGRFDLLVAGDQIHINTSYGNYVYTVTETKVLRFDDPEAIASLSDRQSRKLILYTCYPLDMLGSTDQRLFVYADYTSGPIIDENI